MAQNDIDMATAGRPASAVTRSVVRTFDLKNPTLTTAVLLTVAAFIFGVLLGLLTS